MKKSLVAECEAYLGAGPPAHMDDYVPDSLTEMIIAHGAQEEPLDAELFEIGTLIAGEPGDFEELQDAEIRSYMRKGKALVRAVIDAQRTRVVREALAAYLAPAPTGSWDSLPQPSWNKPGDVASSLAGLLERADEPGQAAYHRFLYSIGNNHAGTYYPVVLWLLPELASLLERGGAKTREAVLDVLIDLVCSFRPEPGFEAAVGPNGVEVDVARSVLQGVLEMRAAIEASPRGLGEAARVEELSQELLHALEDVIRESRP